MKTFRFKLIYSLAIGLISNILSGSAVAIEYVDSSKDVLLIDSEKALVKIESNKPLRTQAPIFLEILKVDNESMKRPFLNTLSGDSQFPSEFLLSPGKHKLQIGRNTQNSDEHAYFELEAESGHVYLIRADRSMLYTDKVWIIDAATNAMVGRVLPPEPYSGPFNPPPRSERPF